MKKIILCFVIVLSLSATTSVFSQPPADADQKAQMQQMMKQYLKDSVQLSDAIVDSVMAARMEFQPQMRAIYMDMSLSADEKQTKMLAIRTQIIARYKAIGLTDDQIKKIEEHDQHMREQMRSHNGSGLGL